MSRLIWPHETGRFGLPISYACEPRLLATVAVSRLDGKDEPKAIKAWLEADPRFRALQDKTITSSGGGSAMQVGHLVMWWIWRGNLVGGDQAKAELSRYLDASTIRTCYAQWVFGPTVWQPRDLGLGFQLVPLSQMPFSFERDAAILAGERYVMPNAGEPTAAIVKWVEEPVVYETGKDPDAMFEIQADARALSLCLNLVPGVSCVPGARTAYSADDTPPGLWASAGSASSFYDVLSSRRCALPDRIDVDLGAVARAYRVLSEADRRRVDLGLHRFAFAKGRTHAAFNQALDLGIALEMFVMPDDPLRKKATLQFRGAELLGGDEAERARNRNTLGEIYRLRSEVAHEGWAADLAGKREPYDSELRSHMDIAGRIIERLILEPRPNWPATPPSAKTGRDHSGTMTPQAVGRAPAVGRVGL